jgi:hypothetical protein
MKTAIVYIKKQKFQSEGDTYEACLASLQEQAKLALGSMYYMTYCPATKEVFAHFEKIGNLYN